MNNYSKLKNIFGDSSDEFKENFNNVLTELNSNKINSTFNAIRWKLIIIIVTIFLLTMTGVAYGILQINFHFIQNVDKADVGDTWVVISVPENYYEEIGKELLCIFYNSELNSSMLPRFSAETAQLLQELLSGNIFTVNGDQLYLLTHELNTNEYFANDKGLAIYDSNNKELAEIGYFYVNEEKPLKLYTRIKEHKEQQRKDELSGHLGIKITSDYNEAAQLLGKDFKVPTLLNEMYDSLEYRIQGLPFIIDDIEITIENNLSVYITGKEKQEVIFFVESVREDEDIIQKSWYIPGAIIEEFIIGGTETTIYKIICNEAVRYIWEHDDIVYMFFQSFGGFEKFSSEQMMALIWDMIH